MATQVRVARRSSVRLFEEYVLKSDTAAFMSHFVFYVVIREAAGRRRCHQKRALTHFAT